MYAIILAISQQCQALYSKKLQRYQRLFPTVQSTKHVYSVIIIKVGLKQFGFD